MFESLIEVAPEVVYALLASGLTALGAIVEVTGVQTLTSGSQTIGLWMLFVGAVALYAGYEVAREKALPAIRGA